MPTPTIPDGELFFNATLYTGTGATQAVANGAPGASFQPDLVWVRNRPNASGGMLLDSVRGSSVFFQTTNANGEAANSGDFVSFNSNGFSVGNNGNLANQSGAAFVGWNWKAGGAAVTNTAGSITSQVSANTTSGFSVVTFNTGSAGNKTVGHGLGVSPAMFIVKNRDGGASQHWNVWHQSFATPSQGYIYLDLTNGVANDSRQWANTAPTSSVFSFESAYTFPASVNMVAYCWSEIEGFSKFGSYTGNGSTDGTFVYLGFRPRWVMIKHTNQAGNNWRLVDTSRLGYNADNYPLFPSLVDGEAATVVCDMLSNGIKFRSTAQGVNGSGDSYIYAAFAENPLKYANAR